MPRGRPRTRLTAEEAKTKGLCVACRKTMPRKGHVTCDYCIQAAKDWRLKNPERYNRLVREWRSRQDPKTLKERAYRSRLKRKYGLTPEGYQELVQLQRGKCAICQNPRRKRLVVDHDHKTGRVRGLLCDPCNVTLGQFQERTYLLRELIRYLEHFK